MLIQLIDLISYFNSVLKRKDWIDLMNTIYFLTKAANIQFNLSFQHIITNLVLLIGLISLLYI